METQVEKCSPHNSQCPVYLIIPYLDLCKTRTYFLYINSAGKAASVKRPCTEIYAHADRSFHASHHLPKVKIYLMIHPHLNQSSQQEIAIGSLEAPHEFLLHEPTTCTGFSSYFLKRIWSILLRGFRGKRGFSKTDKLK